MNACMSCQGDRGLNIRYCDPCLITIQNNRRKGADEARKIALWVDSKPSLLRQRTLLETTMLSFGAFLLAFLVLLTVFLLTKPTNDVVATIYLALACDFVLASFVTWIIFWVSLLAKEPFLAFLSLLFPFVAYRAALLEWGSLRIPFILHFVATGGAMSIVCLLAGKMDKSFFSTLLFVKEAIHFPF